MMSASVRLGVSVSLVVGAVLAPEARADIQLGDQGWKGAQILCCGGGFLCSEEVVFASPALAIACPGSVHEVTVGTTANGQLPFLKPQCNESADVFLRCPSGDVLLGTAPDWNGCGTKIASGKAGPFSVVAAPGCDRIVVRHAGAGHCAARDRFWLRALRLSVGGPPPEVCNGVDDDCDGHVDEGLSCGPPPPTIAIQSPADGAVLNVGSPACAPDPGACVLDVSGAVTNAGGATATLTVDCGAGETQIPATVAGQAVTWPGVSLPDQATCTLAAHVATPGGAADSAPVTVRVDRVSPVVHGFVRPSTDLLTPTDDENPLQAGLQKTVSVSVSGLEAGRTVEVRIVPAGGALDGPPTLSAVLGVGAPDGLPVTVVTGVWTIAAAGSWTVEARVADAAGNGASLQRTISANPTAQVVSVVGPAAPPDACASDATCGAGAICWQGVCRIAWGIYTPKQIQVQTIGVPAGSLVRLCTDLPGAVGPACATPGTVQVGVAALAATAVLVDASSAPDGAQTLFAEAQIVPGVDAWARSMDGAVAFQSRRVLLDTVAPIVVGIACPSDTLPPAGVLSQAEQVAPWSFAFALSGTDAGVALEGAGQLWVNGQLRASFPVSGGAGGAPLTFLTDGTKDVRAVVTDAVGNASLPVSHPLSLSSLWTVKVAPIALSFLAPSGSPILAGASLDVRLIATEVGGTVWLTDGGAPIGAVTVGADHEATFFHAVWGTLGDGPHALTAVLEDFAGNTATAATVPPVVTVDATPPDVAVLAPDVDLTDADDALPAKGGFQAAVVIATTGAETWELLVQGCDPGWTTCGAPVLGASGVAVGGPEAPVALTLPVPAAESWHRIVARARDAAGNLSTATRDVHLSLSACVLTLAGLPTDGAVRMADCAEPGCGSVTRTLLAQWVGPCGGVDLVTLLEDGAPIGQVVPADHEATFPVVFAHGSVTSLWVEATTGGAPVAETAPVEVRVDLVPPTVDFVAADIGGFPAPATGADVIWGAAVDLAPASLITLEGHLRVAMDDGMGGEGRLSLLAGGASLAAPVTLPGLPMSHDFQWISLADQATHTVTVTAEDAVGNSAVASFTATVDLSPPEEVVLEPVSALDVMPRLPAVTLRWQPPASNTGIAGGAAASYEVRYARDPIASEDDWAAACPATDLPNAPVVPAPGDPLGALDAVTLRGPDSRSANATACKWAALADGMWWFAVRATDAAGNTSPVSGGGTVGTDLATLRMARITHSLAVSGVERLDSVVVAVGDVNGDGLPDLALGGGALSGFCLVFGRDGGGAALPDMDLDASAGDGWQCILDPGLTGAGTPVANVGDLNGDGLDDLAVGAGVKVGDPLSAEEVRIYLGSAGGAPLVATPAAIVRGMSNNAIHGMKTLVGARFTGGVSGATGLPLSDVAIPSGLENRVYVLPGSATLTAGAATVIDLTDPAQRDAWSVLTVDVLGVQANAYVGWSLASPGDVVGDGLDELAIAQAKGPAQVIVLAGRPVAGATTVSLSGPGDGSQPGDATAVRLLPELGVGTNSFGDSMDGSADLDGGGSRDLVINHAYASATVGRVYVFRGEALAGHLGGAVMVQPAGPISPDGAQAGLNGVLIHRKQALPVPVGDFDGAWPGEPSTVDLAWGVLGAAVFGPVTLRLNHTPGPAGFPQGTLPTDDLLIADPFADPPSALFGATLAPVGDFDGDGALDLAIGTAGQGWVVIVH